MTRSPAASDAKGDLGARDRPAADWSWRESERDVELLADCAGSSRGSGGARGPEIFDAARRMVEEARELVVADFFLWNGWRGWVGAPPPHELAGEWSRVLIDARRRDAGLAMLVITDPVNRVYGGDAHEAAEIAAVRRAGVPVLYTDLTRLPTTNFLYTPWAAWLSAGLRRLPRVCTWFDRPRWSHPFDPEGPPVSLRQMARLLHLRANHRKVLIADDGQGGLRVLVGSWNPHSASSANVNIAVVAAGPVALEALEEELGIADAAIAHEPSGGAAEIERVLQRVRGLARAYVRRCAERCPAGRPPATDPNRALWLSGDRLLSFLLERFAALSAGDEVRIAMFYLSERRLVKALAVAARRGVNLRLILDYNRNAFGRRKAGIPNRPVAAELAWRTRRAPCPIRVRWAEVGDAQFHPKAVLFSPRAGVPELVVGSANWTARNLYGRNLEAAVAVRGKAAADRFARLFDLAWENRGGLCVTSAYEERAEPLGPTGAKWALYRILERTGAATF